MCVAHDGVLIAVPRRRSAAPTAARGSVLDESLEQNRWRNLPADKPHGGHGSLNLNLCIGAKEEKELPDSCTCTGGRPDQRADVLTSGRLRLPQ